MHKITRNGVKLFAQKVMGKTLHYYVTRSEKGLIRRYYIDPETFSACDKRRGEQGYRGEVDK